MKNDNNTENKNIFPIRIPQAKNIVFWLIGTACLFFIWTAILLRALEFLGFVIIAQSGKSTAPGVVDILVFTGFSFAGYLWRFTLPVSFYNYPKGKFGEATLSFKWQVVATLITIVLFSVTLWWSWESVL